MIERNTVAFVKISREPVFVLETDTTEYDAYTRREVPHMIQVRRFVNNANSSYYTTLFFRPEELLNEEEAEAENKKQALAFITSLPAESESDNNNSPSGLLA